jgi:preprotein translocase subunit SecG
MFTFVTIIHVVLCVFMMFVILLQPGKDAGMGAALGGGAATSAFGGRGAVTFLSKVTAVCAALFFLTSLGLSFVGMKTSVAAGIAVPAKKTAPSPGAGADGGVTSEDVAPVEGEAEHADHSEQAASTESREPSPASTAAPSEKKSASDQKSTSPGTGAAPAKKSVPAPKKP